MSLTRKTVTRRTLAQKSLAWLPVLFLLPLTGQAAGPSFDCADARGEVEHLVCENDDLALLDNELAEAFARSLATTADAEALRAAQRGWVRGRNDCWKADNVNRCIREHYHTRTVELEIASGELEAPTAVNYRCDNEAASRLSVSFYNTSRPPAAVIDNAGDRVIALRAPSASGGRYTAAGVDFHEHHGDAMVLWFGTEMRCQAMTPGTASITARQATKG